MTVCYKVLLSRKLKADLQPAHSLLLAPLFTLCSHLFFPSQKGQPSISEHCFCSVPIHVLLSVLEYCGRSCHPSFSEGEMVQPYPTEPPCAWGSVDVVFMLFPQDSRGITLSDWDNQAKAELPGVTQV